MIISREDYFITQGKHDYVIMWMTTSNNKLEIILIKMVHSHGSVIVEVSSTIFAKYELSQALVSSIATHIFSVVYKV